MEPSPVERHRPDPSGIGNGSALVVDVVAVAGAVVLAVALPVPGGLVAAAALLLVAAARRWAVRRDRGSRARQAALERALLELVDEQRRWPRHIVDALVAPALLFSADDRLLAANAAARETLNVEATDSPSIIQAVGSAAVADAAAEARETDRRVTVDVEVGERELRVRAAPMGDELLIVAVDRTRERQVRDLRRNFVVNASHELKTPAASIQALSDALEVAVRRAREGDPDADERAGSLVAQLGKESARLSKLVHDLLDLRRLEDAAPPDRVPVDLAAVVRTVVAELTPEAGDRDIDVRVRAPRSARLAGLPDDVELIVRNLVGNAVQYNHDGGRVEIDLSARDGSWELTVTDTGVGIPQQDLQRIFERFYRVDVPRSREAGGTGLGLSIVRHAVERHGGHITVDSLLGEGTTFTVVLPVESPD